MACLISQETALQAYVNSLTPDTSEHTPP